MHQNLPPQPLLSPRQALAQCLAQLRALAPAQVPGGPGDPSEHPGDNDPQRCRQILQALCLFNWHHAAWYAQVQVPPESHLPFEVLLVVALAKAKLQQKVARSAPPPPPAPPPLVPSSAIACALSPSASAESRASAFDPARHPSAPLADAAPSGTTIPAPECEASGTPGLPTPCALERGADHVPRKNDQRGRKELSFAHLRSSSSVSGSFSAFRASVPSDLTTQARSNLKTAGGFAPHLHPIIGMSARGERDRSVPPRMPSQPPALRLYTAAVLLPGRPSFDPAHTQAALAGLGGRVGSCVDHITGTVDEAGAT